ncbi:hypothetical protein ACJRO7_034874 [Eucalyptus globulus]|uniref:Secreted protein n=1 Tax=Eucalyptus globulus TaxID=34317 RepID=A0ABD3JAJ0_EUCGL
MGPHSFALVLEYVLAVFCDGGTTSPFVRKDWPSLDMPFDSDVFAAPPGYNAPQQVVSIFCFSSLQKKIGSRSAGSVIKPRLEQCVSGSHNARRSCRQGSDSVMDDS